jgi:hypothetical protein
MWKYLVSRSSYAKRWLIGAVLLQAVLFGIAARFPAREWFIWYGAWTNLEATALLSMLLLLGGAFFMHRYDPTSDGWGFRHVYLGIGGGAHERDEQRYVGSILTVESIRAAMVVVLLAALLGERKHYLPPGGIPHHLPLGLIPKDPGAVFFVLLTAALASSLVTTMAALLCYEYATRFTWQNNWARQNLNWKAFQFGKFGFYCLMWSLAALPVLLDYYLVFVSVLFVFVVMWVYYFFPKQEPSVAVEQA